MKKVKLSNIVMVSIFIGLVFFIVYSPTVDKIFDDRCCKFQSSEISGELSFVKFGKSGNVFRLKEDKEETYFFMNEERWHVPSSIFGRIARVGQQVQKDKFSDTLILYGENEKYYFKVINCCDSLTYPNSDYRNISK